MRSRRQFFQASAVTLGSTLLSVPGRRRFCLGVDKTDAPTGKAPLLSEGTDSILAFEIDEAIGSKLEALFAQMEQAISQQEPATEEPFGAPPSDESRLDSEDQRRIEELFQMAVKDRSRAYELKRELDRLRVFKDYEDRFLDLFKKPD